jgi:hypothetical protein
MGTRLLPSSDDSDYNFSRTLRTRTETLVSQSPPDQSDHQNTPVTGTV